MNQNLSLRKQASDAATAVARAHQEEREAREHDRMSRCRRALADAMYAAFGLEEDDLTITQDYDNSNFVTVVDGLAFATAPNGLGLRVSSPCEDERCSHHVTAGVRFESHIKPGKEHNEDWVREQRAQSLVSLNKHLEGPQSCVERHGHVGHSWQIDEEGELLPEYQPTKQEPAEKSEEPITYEGDLLEALTAFVDMRADMAMERGL